MAPAQAHLQRIYAFHLQLQCNTDTAHAAAHRLTTARNNKLQICCSSKMQIERSKRTKRIVMKCTLNLHRFELFVASIFFSLRSSLGFSICRNFHYRSLGIGYRLSLVAVYTHREFNAISFSFGLGLGLTHDNFVK